MSETAAERWKSENRAALWTRNVQSYVQAYNRVRSFGFVRNGKRYRAVSSWGGPLEFYAVGADGLETFVGYARELLGTVDDRPKNLGASLVNNC